MVNRWLICIIITNSLILIRRIANHHIKLKILCHLLLAPFLIKQLFKQQNLASRPVFNFAVNAIMQIKIVFQAALALLQLALLDLTGTHAALQSSCAEFPCQKQVGRKRLPLFLVIMAAVGQNCFQAVHLPDIPRDYF